MRVFESTSILAYGLALLAAASAASADYYPSNYPSSATPTPSSNRCTSGVCCNLFTQTFHPQGKICRPACGDCDAPEFCTGRSSTCPTDDVLPPTTVCRQAVGDCDNEEKCPGGTDPKTRYYCPADTFKRNNEVCRSKPPGSTCENDGVCSGNSPTCPPREFLPATQACRGTAADGVCNPIEYCTGYSSYCPPDVKLNGCPCASVTLAADDKCATVQCDNGVCRKVPKPAGTLCEAGDITKCTLDAFCDGSTTTCSTRRAASGTICRASKGFCDAPEVCRNSGDCPDDVTNSGDRATICRPATGDCDEAEYCAYNPSDTKPNPNCPSDSKKAKDTICRPKISACDVPEKCDGKSSLCPADVFAGAGVTCNINNPDAVTSVAPENECDAPDTCPGNSPFCVDNRYQCFQPELGVSYAAALLESEVGASGMFHPIAIVPGPAGEEEKASSGSSLRTSRRRD